MIPHDVEARILRFYHVEKWRVGTIARHLGIHHSTVRRVLRAAGLREPKSRGNIRPKLIDAYVDWLVDTLSRYPSIPASRLWEMARERGYSGARDHFRSIVALYRPKPASEAYMRLQTLPGEQGQVDWGSFGHVSVGRAERRLSAFVMALSYSRRPFLRFFYNQQMAFFLQGHVEAFRFFGGVPRVVLYDNLKSAVLERYEQAIRFHPELLTMSTHYNFEPRPCNIARGNEKGRVERLIRYIRDHFFPARTWVDLDDLNAQALAWCEGAASDRTWPQDRTITVREAYESERERLIALPEVDIETAERVAAKVGKTPYVRFDKNDYSVPHLYAGRSLTLVASEHQVRLMDGMECVAEHDRSYDKGAQVEDPGHIEALKIAKGQRRPNERKKDRLADAVPASAALLAAVAERGDNLGSATAAMMRLLTTYGAVALQEATCEALSANSPHPNSVRCLLEKRQREQNMPPAIAIEMPEAAQNQPHIRPHNLQSYDLLATETHHEQ